MQPEPPAPKPSRKRHLVRWISVAILAILGWYGWKAYDFRLAVIEATGLGWEFRYNDSIAIIRDDWRKAFRKDTWSDPYRGLLIKNRDQLESYFDLIHRLNPTSMEMYRVSRLENLSVLNGLSNLTTIQVIECQNLTNISALKGMKELTWLSIRNCPSVANIDPIKELINLTHLDLIGCTALIDVDALRGLNSLETLSLSNCTGLQNVDGIRGLTGMHKVDLSDCTGLTLEAWLRARRALPTTKFQSFVAE